MTYLQHPELRRLVKPSSIDDIRMDFPVENRLVSERLSIQCDYLSPELIQLAGQIGMGIDISQYWPSEDEEHSVLHNGA